MKTKLIIFGITGDLSRRKLLPVLNQIVKGGDCEPLSIIGVSRREVNVPELIQESTQSDLLAERTTVHTMDLATPSDYIGLKESVDLQSDEQAVIYLSVPPSAAADIVDFLGEAGLNTPNVKIMFEKPFGFDLQSARDFIKRTMRYFTEDQIYRIDHYMAKEVAAEIIRMHVSAEQHHRDWNNKKVASIEIVASELLGVEDRAAFYEQTGALRDILQGHLMQLLSLVLLDASGDFDLEILPSRRLDALQALQPAEPVKAIRAQYEGYDGEVANPGSQTETFASVELFSDAPGWQNVPLRLTTGKRLNEKKTAITIHYKDGTSDVFEEGKVGPDNVSLPDAYERVLVEAIQGRKYIFTTSPEIIRSWQILAPVQLDWEMDSAPLRHYPQGTDAQQLIS